MKQRFESGVPGYSHYDKESAEGDAEASGLYGSTRNLLFSLLCVLQKRLELFSVELREARIGALFILGWSVALIFFSFLIVMTTLALLVVFFWHQGEGVLIGCTIFFSIAALVCFGIARAKLAVLPFAESLTQLQKDRDLITGRAEVVVVRPVSDSEQ